MAYDAAMHQYEKQYDGLKAELQTLGFIGQGSSPPAGSVWEARLSLPQRRRRVTARTTTGRARRAERPSACSPRRTRPVPGMDREQPGTRTAREGAPSPHHPGRLHDPRVSGSPATVAVTAILHAGPVLTSLAPPPQAKLGRTRFSQEAPEIPTRPQTRAAQPTRVEGLAQPLHEGVKPGFFQDPAAAKKGCPSLVGRSSVFTHIGDACRAVSCPSPCHAV